MENADLKKIRRVLDLLGDVSKHEIESDDNCSAVLQNISTAAMATMSARHAMERRGDTLPQED